MNGRPTFVSQEIKQVGRMVDTPIIRFFYNNELLIKCLCNVITLTDTHLNIEQKLLPILNFW